ncbi:acyl-CoA dehydrogenase family protein, partial [Leptospira levettii]
MNFYFTEEQNALREAVAAYSKIAGSDPNRDVEERDSEFSWDVLHALGDRGWTGVIVPEQYGGLGKGAMEYTIIMEETAKELIYGPQNLIQAQQGLLAVGTEEQKSKWLPELAK